MLWLTVVIVWLLGLLPFLLKHPPEGVRLHAVLLFDGADDANDAGDASSPPLYT